MRKGILCIVCFITALTTSFSQKEDLKIEQQILQLAADFEHEELSQLFEHYGQQLPPVYQHYCLFSLKKSSFQYENALAEIDSLTQGYNLLLPYHTKLSLVYYKAQMLFLTKQYVKLNSFCKQKIKFYKYVKDAQTLIEELKIYQRKALSIIESSKADSLLLSEAYANNFLALNKDFKNYSSQAKPFTELWCSFLLGHSFHYGDCTSRLAVIDTLIINYANTLDTENLNKLFTDGCKLYQEGLPASTICQTIAGWEKHLKKFRPNEESTFWYHYLCALKDTPASETKLTKASNIVPLSKEYPLTLSCKINNKKIRQLLLDISSPFTILSKEVANECQLHEIPYHLDSISILSNYHIKLAIADSLRIDNIILTNFPVAVVDSIKNGLHSNNISILGNDILKRLGKIIFTKNTLAIFPKRKKEVIDPNLFFADDGKLMISSSTKINKKDSDVYFSFTTETTNNYLSSKELMKEGRSYHFGKEYLRLPNKKLITKSPYYYAGHLGFPFIRSFKRLTFNFDTMNFAPYEVLDYQYDTYQDCLNSGNWFKLEEYLPYYNIGMTPNIKKLISLVIASGKNNPKEVDALAKTLLNSKEKEELPTSFIKQLNYEALFKLGRYQEAKNLSLLQTEDELLETNNINLLQQDIELCTKLEKTPKSRYIFKKQQGQIKIKWIEKGLARLKIHLNNKRINAFVDLSHSNCFVSKELVDKLNLQIIMEDYFLDEKPRDVVIIKQLALGNLTIENLICYVTNQKKYSFIIGNSLLAQVPEITFKKKAITYNTKAKTLKDGTPIRIDGENILALAHNGDKEIVLRFQPNSKLNVNTSTSVLPYLKVNKYYLPIATTNNEVEVLPHHCKSTISIADLIKQNFQVTFNFKEMTLNLSKIIRTKTSNYLPSLKKIFTKESTSLRNFESLK